MNDYRLIEMVVEHKNRKLQLTRAIFASVPVDDCDVFLPIFEMYTELLCNLNSNCYSIRWDDGKPPN